jgi:hypothetical protein
MQGVSVGPGKIGKIGYCKMKNSLISRTSIMKPKDFTAGYPAPEAAENLSSLGKDPLHFPRP